MVRAADFDWQTYVRRRLPQDGVNYRAVRVRQTKHDPLLFGLVYFGKHLASLETGGVISFSDFHLDLCAYAKSWATQTGPMENRHGWVGPRGVGKSTWLFLILPTWALAHGHRKYVAAFADTATQAEQHLKSFKMELDNNDLLRFDFPTFAQAALRLDGRKVGDDQSLTIRGNGAIFQAKGIDSSALGAKVGSQRPDVLLFDDIEPDEANYSAYQKKQRLSTILQAVFPMNTSAVVTFAGTVTMPGSVIHDLVKSVTEGPDVERQWVTDERIQAHHYPALATDDDGTERSTWPARWTLEYLMSIRHTRSFAMNFQNEPVSTDGMYWVPADITYADTVPTPQLGFIRTALVLDPAVTDGKSSDFTGVAIGSLRPGTATTPPLVVVRHLSQVKLPARALRDHCLRLLEQHHVHRTFIEGNQGANLWLEIFADWPTDVSLMHASEPKEWRAAMALNHYQSLPRRVQHMQRFASAEEQMLAFPNTVNDDQVDAVSHLVRVLLEPHTVTVTATVGRSGKRQQRVTVSSYL